MKKVTITYVTIEEAVAKMVNMDYIPDGFTLEEMLSAFAEEAEVDYENSQIDCLPKTQIEPLRTRLEVCKARETLAIMLLKDLEETLKINPSITNHMRLHGSTGKPRYMLEIIADWISHKYGIAIPVWPALHAKPSSSTDTLIDMIWENIEIRIRKDNKIAHSYNSGPWFEKSFADIGLLDKKTQKPNRQGSILIALSMGMKFPDKGNISPKDKTSISKLRSSLKALTGIESDPFIPFTDADGWKPRFKLIDRRKDADERERKTAIHEQYEDDRLLFDQLDDTAGIWLDEND